MPRILMPNPAATPHCFMLRVTHDRKALLQWLDSYIEGRYRLYRTVSPTVSITGGFFAVAFADLPDAVIFSITQRDIWDQGFEPLERNAKGVVTVWRHTTSWLT